MNIANAGGSGRHRAPEPRYLSVARIIRPFGLNGELKLDVLTGFPDKLGRLKRVYLGPDAAPHEVTRLRWHRGDLLLVLADVGDRDAAEALRGQLVQICREDAVPLGEGEYYERQIIGLAVLTAEGEPLGQIVEVVKTGANDVYVVKGPRGEVLLPARAEVVRSIDLDAGTMTVTLLPGLLPEDE